MKQIDSERVKKILLVTFSNLGDAVLSVPVLEHLKRRFGKSMIDVIAGPRSRVIFEKDPRIHRIFVYERSQRFREKAAFFLRLWKHRYDLVVDLRRTFFSFLGRPWANLLGWGSSAHKRDCQLDVLKRLGVEVDGAYGVLGRDPVAERRIQEKLASLGVRRAEKPLIVIAPGARSHIKRWPQDRFAMLADRLIYHDEAQVIWMGDSTERELIAEIQREMNHPSVNLAGATSWNESVHLIRLADLLITNDSASLHVGDHLGKKILSFFGPTDPKKYGTQRTPQGILFRNKFCSPCGKAQCRYSLECLKEISLDEAYKRAGALLQGRRGGRPLRALVVRLDRMGDMLLSFSAFQALRRKFPDCVLTALARPYTQELAERSKDISAVISYDYGSRGVHRSPRGYFRLIREIRKHRFDVAFVLHPTLRSHLLCFLSGIPRRIGYETRGSVFLTQTIEDRRHEGHQHESHFAMDVLRPYGVEPVFDNPGFRVFLDDRIKADRLLEEQGIGRGEGFIIFHPGSSSPSKRWPDENFSRLGRLVRTEWQLKIVLIGSEGHAADNARTAQSIGEGCVDLTAKTPFSCLAAVLERCEIMVSNDSGPVHLASLLGKRVISIFGRNQQGLSPRRWRPLADRSEVIQRDVGCVVCMADACPIDFECLKAIGPETVFQAVASLLKMEESR